MNELSINIRAAINEIVSTSAEIDAETLAISKQSMWHVFVQVAGLYGAAYLFLRLL